MLATMITTYRSRPDLRPVGWQYLYDSIASFLTTASQHFIHPLILNVDMTDAPHAPGWSVTEYANIAQIPRKYKRLRNDDGQPPTVTERFLQQMNNALRTGSDRRDQSGLLILEDDIIFRAGWYKHLLKLTIAQRDIACIIALYSHRNYLEQPSDYSSGLTSPHSEGFYGTPALWYSEPALDRIGSRFAYRMIENPGNGHDFWAGDLLLGDMCRQMSIPIYASRYALAQHVGDVSTGLHVGRVNYRNKSFDVSLPE